MSAIGSVIVMVTWSLSRRGSPLPPDPDLPDGWSRAYGDSSLVIRCGADASWPDRSQLPAALADTGQFAAVRHLSDADAAQPELAQHRAGTPALLAAGVAADLELRLGRGLDDEGLLGHLTPPWNAGREAQTATSYSSHASLNGKPRRRSSARPSSSVVAVVTTVMSMPRGRSMLSG